MIEVVHYPELSLVVHRPAGDLNMAELGEAARKLYELETPPLLSLWDLSEVTSLDATFNRTSSFQAKVQPHVHGRDGGKTAIVAPADFIYGAVAQYLALAETLDLPFAQRAFRNLTDALAWLEVRLPEAS